MQTLPLFPFRRPQQLASVWLKYRMALSKDLDTLCTQQLFRAAESLELELDDFDCVLSQTSEAELSAFCTVGPSPSSWTDFVPHAVPSFSSTHQASSIAVSSHLPVLQSRPPLQPISASPNRPPRFASPKRDLDVKAAQAHAVPQNLYSTVVYSSHFEVAKNTAA